jgi:hypothetical protein
MGALTLYPQRQRCVSCRSYFTSLILAGQYCSYECAGQDPPSDDPADWPRRHYRPSYDRYKRIEKTPYASLAEAEFVKLAGDATLASYLCLYCLFWHNGHLDEREYA